jgi:hypothetical protein
MMKMVVGVDMRVYSSVEWRISRISSWKKKGGEIQHFRVAVAAAAACGSAQSLDQKGCKKMWIFSAIQLQFQEKRFCPKCLFHGLLLITEGLPVQRML